MRVLVVAHRLDLGGTQTNAIELADVMQRRGIADLTLAAAPGPAAEWARAKGVDLRLIPDAEHHPSWVRARALQDIATEVRPDLVHVWDWPQCFDAYPTLHLRMRLPMLCTVMGMVVPSFIPRHLPTTFGTAALARAAQAARRGDVWLLEPPVDLIANAEGAVDGAAFRRAHGVRDDELLVAMVCRLETWLKFEGLHRSIEAVDLLAETLPVRLVVVGEGSAREAVEREADRVNTRHGREVVTLAGRLLDPRPAYAAADVMVGMGGSALRTLAFGTPLVVVGEQGFSRVLDPDTAATFLDQGWYGLGDGRPDDLAAQLGALLVDPEQRRELGRFGRGLVEERFDVEHAAANLGGWYRLAAGHGVPRGRAVLEGSRTIAMLAARGAVRVTRHRLNRARRESHGH